QQQPSRSITSACPSSPVLSVSAAHTHPARRLLDPASHIQIVTGYLFLKLVYVHSGRCSKKKIGRDRHVALHTWNLLQHQ
ncbi:hypothetical protein KUCAC02_008872, partial [Chaenocephalus aceratus]